MTEDIINVVMDIGDDIYYSSKRYKVDTTTIIIKSKFLFTYFDDYSRQIDVVQQLTSDLLVVILPHTNKEQAVKYIDKMKNNTNEKFKEYIYLNFQIKKLYSLSLKT